MYNDPAMKQSGFHGMSAKSFERCSFGEPTNYNLTFLPPAHVTTLPTEKPPFTSTGVIFLDPIPKPCQGGSGERCSGS